MDDLDYSSDLDTTSEEVTESSDDIEFLDTSDISGGDAEAVLDIEVDSEDALTDDAPEEVDDGFYHASRMSSEEVHRIDDLWSDEDSSQTSDVEPYQATRMTDAEVDAIDDMWEDDFDEGIDDTSSDELIDTPPGLDIDPEQTWLDGLDRGSLEQLREGLLSGNPDIYDYLGLSENDGSSDGTDEMKLSLTRGR